MIEFNHVARNVMLDLTLEGRLGILRHHTLAMLEAAFRHGAYVAGGFAHVVADDVAKRRVHEYLRVYERIDRSKQCWKGGRGDIDIFFQSSDGLDAFYAEIMANSAKYFTSSYEPASRSCVELDCDDVVSVQVITKYIGPIENVLADFDIYNAMVAFNDKELILPVGWKELNEQRVLHVANWTSPYVIHRINKWFNKHCYRDLSPATALELGTQALEIMNRLKKEPIEMPWGKITADNVAHKLKRFLPRLTNDDLLMLLSVYPADVYNGAFTVLAHRGKLPTLTDQ